MINYAGGPVSYRRDLNGNILKTSGRQNVNGPESSMSDPTMDATKRFMYDRKKNYEIEASRKQQEIKNLANDNQYGRVDYSGRRQSAPNYSNGRQMRVGLAPYQTGSPVYDGQGNIIGNQPAYNVRDGRPPMVPTNDNKAEGMQTYDQWQPNATSPYTLTDGYHDSTGQVQDEVVYPNSARNQARQGVYDRQQDRASNRGIEQRGNYEQAQRSAAAPKDTIPTLIEMERSLMQIRPRDQIRALDEFFSSFGQSTQLNSRQYADLKKEAYALANKNLSDYNKNKTSNQRQMTGASYGNY